MNGSTFIAWIAALLALGSGMFLSGVIYESFERRSTALDALDEDGKSSVLVRLQGGVKFLRKPAEALLRVPQVRGLTDNAILLCQGKNLVMTEVALVSSSLGVFLVLTLIGTFLSRSFVFGLACSGVAIGCVGTWVKRRTDALNLEMREKVPDALRSFATCFRSGLSLLQTLTQASREMGGRLGQLFRNAAHRLEMGETTTEALSILQSDKDVPELSFIAVALDIQHQSGGSLAPIFESARDSVESELELMRSLRVQTAQAKLSANIVTIMPFLLIALFSFLSPGFLSPFFSSFVGIALLALALIMQVTGVLIVRRLLAIESGD